MNTTQIVDLIFDLHRDFINPKVIARRQVTRLIDRLLTRVAPELILNRTTENKENVGAQATPAKEGMNPIPAIGIAELPAPAMYNPTDFADQKERKNLALQLNQVR